jgi:hypothetical protein
MVRRQLKRMDVRQLAALLLGSFLLLAALAGLIVTGEFNVALGGAGVSIFGLAFTLPRDDRRHNGSDDTPPPPGRGTHVPP